MKILWFGKHPRRPRRSTVSLAAKRHLRADPWLRSDVLREMTWRFLWRITGWKNPPGHRHPRFYDDFMMTSSPNGWVHLQSWIKYGKMMTLTLTSRFPWISGQKHLDHSEVGGPEHAQHQDDAAPEPAGKSREPQFQCEGRCKGWFLGGFNSKVPRCFQGVSDGFQWLLIVLQRFS